MRKPSLQPGIRFGRLAFVDVIGMATDGSDLWRCLCDCGQTKHASAHDLLSGDIRHCGCGGHHAA